MNDRRNAFDSASTQDLFGRGAFLGRKPQPPRTSAGDAGPLNVRMLVVDQWATLTVSGTVDRPGLSDLGWAMRDLLGLGPRALSIDITGLRGATPLTVALLATGIQRLRKTGTFVKVRGPSKLNAELLRKVREKDEPK